MSRPPTSLAEAGVWAAEARAAGLVIVTTNGCYDLIHAGHLDTLEGARALGDALIVLINSDSSVKRFKGSERPFLDQEARARLLNALRVVDRVVVFDEDTPLAAIEAIRPHIHVKGGTYIPERVADEEALVARWGGRLEFVPLRPGTSSTDLAQRIRAARTGEAARSVDTKRVGDGAPTGEMERTVEVDPHPQRQERT